MAQDNIDPQEVAKFEAMAHRWWDPEGDFRPLHDLNPLRCQWIADRAPLAGARLLDVGCGGGLVSEAMARYGAEVTGVDAAEGPLTVARLHALDGGLEIRYLHSTVEGLGEEEAPFDVITCLEMLEHVPDPGAVVAACAERLKPGGHLFLSTLNRSLKSWLFGVVGAEYVLNLLPRGTHEYEKFLRPSELAGLGRKAGLRLEGIAGLHYDPIRRKAWLNARADVNYLMHFTR
jgi:2-polyprenyl-6-hydroxyphenyl methylase/3-demethylubiquinone-9 3-methyltransferase